MEKMNRKPPKPSPAVTTSIHEAFTSSLKPDLPLLMHGSGDVEPDSVDPSTVDILARLTANYVSRLVTAAVDAHDIFTDGAGGLCPPPPPPPSSISSSARKAQLRSAGLVSNRKRKRSNDFDGSAPPDSAAPAPAPAPAPTPGWGVAEGEEEEEGRVRKGCEDDFWDNPLPDPVIRKGNDRLEVEREEEEEEEEPLDPHDWVGAEGVDVFAADRRKPHASVPTAIWTQCFIFPVCHDEDLYSRVMEVQRDRRNVLPLLLDQVWMDAARAEISWDPSQDGDGETSSSNRPPPFPADAQVTWPGLEGLLPTHKEDD